MTIHEPPKHLEDFVTRSSHMGAPHFTYAFANGYGASILHHEYANGGFELAVTKGKGLCYDTPITDDVLGYLSNDEAVEILDQIAALPAVDLR